MRTRKAREACKKWGHLIICILKMYSFHNFLFYILFYDVLYILSMNFEKTLCTLDLYKALILRFPEHYLWYWSTAWKFSIFSHIWTEYGLEKRRIRTLFMQWWFTNFYFVKYIIVCPFLSAGNHNGKRRGHICLLFWDQGRIMNKNKNKDTVSIHSNEIILLHKKWSFH